MAWAACLSAIGAATPIPGQDVSQIVSDYHSAPAIGSGELYARSLSLDVRLPTLSWSCSSSPRGISECCDIELPL